MDFELTIPTRWTDFDALGHLNHAIYHVYLDEARDDVLRKTVGDIETWPNVVVHASIDYRREIALGARAVVVHTRIAEIGRSSVHFVQTVTPIDGEIAVQADAVLVAWDPATRRSREITQDERDKFTSAA
jgi:acyl-CoA thioester hydrolase